MQKSKTQNLVMCSVFVALIAAGAFIKIPVPVVPFIYLAAFIYNDGWSFAWRKTWRCLCGSIYSDGASRASHICGRRRFGICSETEF